MTRMRLDFTSLTLFEDEDWGSVHMAMYAAVRDDTGTVIGSFSWNNLANEVDEVATYPLNVDPSLPNVVDVELPTWGTVEVHGYTHDDNAWPSPADHENDLGGASITVDGRVAATLGALTIGPTTTDENDTGFKVDVHATVVAAPQKADIRLNFKDLILYEDEDWGSVRMAVYVHAKAPAQGGVDAIDQEILRWNNAGNEVDEVAAYSLANGGVNTTVRLIVGGPTQIWVEAYTHDDDAWPNGGNYENALGQATITVDPGDPTTLGTRTMGPTTTDDDDQGYEINVSAEALPPAGPSLSITGLEVTQAIQHFGTGLGPDDSVSLVARRLTLVRVYLDSGLDPAVGGGAVADVIGTLTVTGDDSFTTTSIAPMTAKAIGAVNRTALTDTLNFLVPADKVHGTLTFTVQATVAASISNPASRTMSFAAVRRRDILMVRVASGALAAPSQSAYVASINRLPLVYPLPSDPAAAVTYWVVPGSETFTNTHDLTTDDGMSDLLDDLEDIQEESADEKKCYGLLDNAVPMARFGTSRPDDNVALGWSFIMESIGHELGHLYGLDHAPCGNPDDPDDDFTPSDGSIGDVGVDPAAMVAFPATTSDLMSYCGDRGATAYENQWISSYHWGKLQDEFR